MKETLKDFVLDWNKSHKRFTFALQEIPIVDKPASIEVRYSAAKYRSFLTLDNWELLNDLVEAKSHGTMYFVSDLQLFERGIIEAKIASSNHNYSERILIGILRWMGEDFFSYKNKKS